MKNKVKKYAIRKYADYEDLCEVSGFVVAISPIAFMLGIFIIPILHLFHEITPYFLAISIVIYSLITTIRYCIKRNRKFYFADLSHQGLHGLFIFVSCFIAWPVFVISGIRFLIFKKRIKMRDAYKVSLKEGAPLSKIKPTFDKIGFTEFHYDTLKPYINIKRKDSMLAFAKIKAISDIRQILIDEQGRLTIAAWITCELEGETYDIGDFRIIVNGNHLEALCDRRGNDCLLYSHYPLYARNVFYSDDSYDKFYLLDKKKVIDSYIKEGNIAEAVRLTIETIRHVNENRLELWKEFSE